MSYGHLATVFSLFSMLRCLSERRVRADPISRVAPKHTQIHIQTLVLDPISRVHLNIHKHKQNLMCNVQQSPFRHCLSREEYHSHRTWPTFSYHLHRTWPTFSYHLHRTWPTFYTNDVSFTQDMTYFLDSYESFTQDLTCFLHSWPIIDTGLDLLPTLMTYHLYRTWPTFYIHNLSFTQDLTHFLHSWRIIHTGLDLLSTLMTYFLHSWPTFYNHDVSFISRYETYGRRELLVCKTPTLGEAEENNLLINR